MYSLVTKSSLIRPTSFMKPASGCLFCNASKGISEMSFFIMSNCPHGTFEIISYNSGALY